MGWGSGTMSQSQICVLLFFKIFFFDVDYFLSLLNLLQYRFCFMFGGFGPEACGILEGGTHTPCLEGEILTTEPPGKSLPLH